MTDCQLGVISPRLLNPEKKNATRRLLFDRTIAWGLQAKIAFSSSADNDLNVVDGRSKVGDLLVGKYRIERILRFCNRRYGNS